MGILTKFFGISGEADIKKLQPIVEQINSLELEFEKLSTEELKNKTGEFRKRIADGASLDDLLPEAFAAVREASKRTLGQRHYDVQLMGGIVLHQGKIAEMKTGEGKTLVATLSAYLNAISGEGVHIVTVNDYLSRRDAVWMGEIYNALGLKTGVLNHDASFLYDPAHEANKEEDKERDQLGSFNVVHEFLRPVTRREAYAADITYGTNNEFGFDYLRDNMAYTESQVSQRGHNFAIVDEVDSILIDEARTPLIISMPDAESGELYKIFSKIVPRLKKEEDYKVDEKQKAATLTEAGIEKIESILGIKDLYTERGMRYVHHLEQALRAQALFERDINYVVKGGAVIIVDEFTGRLMPGRRWSDGLHQAIEDKVLQTEAGKFKAVAREVKARHDKGQPVLIGTVSIEKNERLSAILKREGVPHELLNAKNHEQEAEIIAQAGKKGRVTLATNIAGRGVDIILGGNPFSTVESEKVKEAGGLYVLGTERHEARRIDNQLRGRSGRQGDPGESQFFVSLEADLMRIFGSEKIKNMMGSFGIPEDEPLEHKLVSNAIESAQAKIEGFHFDARKNLLEYDDVMNKQRKSVYERRKKVLYSSDEEFKEIYKTYLGEEVTDEILAKKEEELKDSFLPTLRTYLLRTIDLLWMEHLELMEYTRSSVRLRAYGQRDPLVEYKNEAIRLFRELEGSMSANFSNSILHLGEHTHPGEKKHEVQIIAPPSNKNEPGRNDPCPCGSGKKYKKCGMLNTEEHKKNLERK